MGGTYRKQDDYFLPNLAASEKDGCPISVWGQRYLRYIREHRKGFYTGLQLSSKFDNYWLISANKREKCFLGW